MTIQNTLWNNMKNENNVTTTENGDKAYKSSLNALLDFLFKAGTMRNASDEEIINLFSNALAENEVYAVRLAFYNRDIRGGQGERRFFRICMKYLATTRPDTFNKIIKFIPEYGRWDDLIYLYFNINSFNIKDSIFRMIADQLIKDLENCKNNKPISLLAKWMPSENASSATTKAMAKGLINNLGLSPKAYRKTLSLLRKKLDVVEVKMSAKEYDKINYSTVPSIAMKNYNHAFAKNDEERFANYINELSSPNSTVKVNASTLYPFDIIAKLTDGNYSFGVDVLSVNDVKLLDAQWNALPDFFEGKFDNALVVADTSGSMYGTPINVCIGLAMYIAERNKGLFNNKFITFSGNPKLQEIKGKNIVEKAINLSQAEWGNNTDLNNVFKLLYNTAIKNNLKQEDLPSMLYIISDMQFDSCCTGCKYTVFEKWQQKFAEANYKLPTVCFWNVSQYGNYNMPITINNEGVILCSGYSPAIIKYIMESDISDALLLVKNIVESKRYNSILA